MLWLMAAIFLITVLLLVLLKRDASRIDDYFCNAVTVHTLTGDEGARIAALIAGKLAAGSRRASMLLYLRGIASDTPTGADFDIVRSRLVELADELAAKDWDRDDIREQKAFLGRLDAEYLAALNRYDPNVFQKRWPKLFCHGDKRKPRF